MILLNDSSHAPSANRNIRLRLLLKLGETRSNFCLTNLVHNFDLDLCIHFTGITVSMLFDEDA
jgi:hypothetical protein